jgi:hypothetical protein
MAAATGIFRSCDLWMGLIVVLGVVRADTAA